MTPVSDWLYLFLDEYTNSQELVQLAWTYPARKVRIFWRSHESTEGLILFREHVSETASIDNTGGSTHDTRAFLWLSVWYNLNHRKDVNYIFQTCGLVY
jgi:glucuronate isomerase